MIYELSQWKEFNTVFQYTMTSLWSDKDKTKTELSIQHVLTKMLGKEHYWIVTFIFKL